MGIATGIGIDQGPVSASRVSDLAEVSLTLFRTHTHAGLRCALLYCIMLRCGWIGASITVGTLHTVQEQKY